LFTEVHQDVEHVGFMGKRRGSGGDAGIVSHVDLQNACAHAIGPKPLFAPVTSTVRPSFM